MVDAEKVAYMVSLAERAIARCQDDADPILPVCESVLILAREWHLSHRPDCAVRRRPALTSQRRRP